MIRTVHRAMLALAAAAALAVPALARAESLVVPGSEYQVYFQGSVSGSTSATVRFDGTEEWFNAELLTGDTLLFGAQEAETDLGGGRWAIDIQLIGEPQLFPVAGETGWANVGFNTMPLQLSRAVRMDRALISFHLADGSLYSGSSWDITAYAAQPWDGYMTQGGTYGFTDVGDQDVRQVRFHFEVSAVPEPASLALWLGGAALLLARRRYSVAGRAGVQSAD
ncbi:PEP-CTERM sorting domain-containing protein [Aquabacterium sp. OR-4]|uniref:PEP-CTERM sorting domain-containing protein n=1 Tax=Aquabacterium sp. OR-4 TaxID=2978127 RepID=UPI0021B15ECB|nr:PEP-CTERM sorting domain-containing protein [Aquabacterium sp. OR-4]MDT7835646.1 PEP-CTERM sorting domain-containing protein [Aquabacterium sp. OR-4]